MGGVKKKENTSKKSSTKTTTKKKKDVGTTYTSSNTKDTYDCMSYTYTHYATGNGSGKISNYFTSKKDI